MLVKKSSTRNWWLAGIMLATFAVVFIAPDLMAQDAGADGGGAAGDDAGEGQTVLEGIMGGGVAMLALAILSVAMVTLIVFNLLQMMGGKFVPKV